MASHDLGRENVEGILGEQFRLISCTMRYPYRRSLPTNRFRTMAGHGMRLPIWSSHVINRAPTVHLCVTFTHRRLVRAPRLLIAALAVGLTVPSFLLSAPHHVAAVGSRRRPRRPRRTSTPTACARRGGRAVPTTATAEPSTSSTATGKRGNVPGRAWIWAWPAGRVTTFSAVGRHRRPQLQAAPSLAIGAPGRNSHGRCRPIWVRSDGDRNLTMINLFNGTAPARQLGAQVLMLAGHQLVVSAPAGGRRQPLGGRATAGLAADHQRAPWRGPRMTLTQSSRVPGSAETTGSRAGRSGPRRSWGREPDTRRCRVCDPAVHERSKPLSSGWPVSKPPGLRHFGCRPARPGYRGSCAWRDHRGRPLDEGQVHVPQARPSDPPRAVLAGRDTAAFRAASARPLPWASTPGTS